MNELTQLTVEQFLDAVAQRTPTPGGGGVAALAAALACSLGRMVGEYSITAKTEPAVAEAVRQFVGRLRTIDEMLRALITQDANAYAAMTDAAKRRKEGEAPDEEYGRAVMSALAVPMEIAAAGGSALEVMDTFKERASRYLLSDLGVAAALADGTVRAAKFTVLVNLGELADEAMRTKLTGDVTRIETHAGQRSRSIQDYVRGQL